MTVDPNVTASGWAGAGGVAGLATIFLPLLQALPVGLTPAEVRTSVVAGMVMVITSVAGKLVHHGFLNKSQAATVVADAPAVITEADTVIEKLPIVEKVVDDVKKEAKQVETSLKARLDHLETVDPEVKVAIADVSPEVAQAVSALAVLMAREAATKNTGHVGAGS